MHDVSVVIPWRSSGDVHREANLTAVLDHLTPLGLPLILASDERESGPFNRSAAYNHGVRLSPSNVYVWHEADSLVPLDQIEDAIRVAQHAPGLVVPFTRYRYMSEQASQLILSGMNPEAMRPQWVMDNGRSIGAVGVCSAESLATVGRWDETLAGHGYDDDAMWTAFRIACGNSTMIHGDLTHLWHPMAYAPWEAGQRTEASDPANFSPEEVEATRRNRARVAQYAACTTPEQVRALTMETPT